jgi:hypothetical protein
MAEMEAMRRTLVNLVHCCQGDSRPDCPILDELGGAPTVTGDRVGVSGVSDR